MSPLFSPFALGPLPLRNRIVIAPMRQCSAVDGAAPDWCLAHPGRLTLSGAALQRALQAVRAHSRMPIAIQLGHAGRVA